MFSAEIEEYLEMLKGNFKNYSECTITNYIAGLKVFNEIVLENGTIDALDVKEVDITHYVECMMVEKGYSTSTVRARLSQVKNMYNYFMNCGYVERNPVNAMHYPRKEKQRFSSFTQREFLSLRNYLERHSSLNYALCADLMRTSGLRIGEVSRIDVINDITMQNGTYIINVRAKGQKDREVPIFSEYSHKRIKELRESHDSLLPLKLGVYQQNLQYHIDSWKKFNNVQKNLTTHDLRRSFAESAMNATGDIDVVRSLMGHSSYSTTLIYLYQRDKANKIALQKIHFAE